MNHATSLHLISVGSHEPLRCVPQKRRVAKGGVYCTFAQEGTIQE